MDNEDPIVAGEDLARLDDDAQAEGLAAEPDTFEVELDGEVHALPAALKGAFLRQADYTRKTQELAEHRRALEAERQALADRAGAGEAASRDRLRLAALDDQLEDFQEVDWEGFAAQDPEGAQALWAAFQRTGEAREQLAYALTHHESRRQLEAAREAAEAMAETGRKLSEEIDGWSPEVASKLVDYAQAFGVTLDELRQMADPRLWKLLHKAYQADQAGQREAQDQARAIRPAVSVAGGGASGAGVRDELATKEWMRRRNEQMARGQ
jgi:hypothetical protein